jgi:hypothetical protein
MSLSFALSIWEPLLAGAALELVEEPTPFDEFGSSAMYWFWQSQVRTHLNCM